MTKFSLLVLAGTMLILNTAIAQPETSHNYDQQVIKEIYVSALEDNQAYEWLEGLTTIGGRLAGSPEAEEAVQYFKNIADSLGFTTSLQKVKVPYWKRGEPEKAYYTTNNERKEVNICALGGSVATPDGGLGAPVVEIRSFEQLSEMDDELEGKIAFYNIPMDPAYINTFFAYSNAVKQRYVGALEASKKGAVGVVVRSLSSSINEFPHTGSMTYADAERKIPAAAISTAGANRLSSDLKKDPDLHFHFEMNCEWQDSTYANNLIAEIPGNSKPGEVILVGGHIDSWDIGEGAHDDGAGCVHALEAAHLLKRLDLMPSRTLRVVFFMNEEFGLNGARDYAQISAEENINHVIAIESDAGGFTPRGISIVAPDSIINRIKEFRDYFEPYGIHQFSQTGAGADIGQLYAEDMVLIGLRPDSHRYFDVHHSAMDVFESVNARELEMGSATLATLIYLLDKYNVTAK